jgi:hypothetical protein
MAAVSIDELPRPLRDILWATRAPGRHFGGARVAAPPRRDRTEMADLHRRSRFETLSIEEVVRLGQLAEASEDSAVVVSWTVDERGNLARIFRMFCRPHQSAFPRHSLPFSWGDGNRGNDLGTAILNALYGHPDRGLAFELLGPMIAAFDPTWHLGADEINRRVAHHKLERAIVRALQENIDVRAVVDALVPVAREENADG